MNTMISCDWEIFYFENSCNEVYYAESIAASVRAKNERVA